MVKVYSYSINTVQNLSTLYQTIWFMCTHIHSTLYQTIWFVLCRVAKLQWQSIAALLASYLRMGLMKDLSVAAAFTKYNQRLISVRTEPRC